MQSAGSEKGKKQRVKEEEEMQWVAEVDRLMAPPCLEGTAVSEGKSAGTAVVRWAARTYNQGLR